jgi:hypothetical protein
MTLPCFCGWLYGYMTLFFVSSAAAAPKQGFMLPAADGRGAAAQM